MTWWPAPRLDDTRVRVMVTVAPGSAPSPETVMLSPGVTVDSDTVRPLLGSGGYVWALAGVANNARTAAKASAETTFRMRMFLLVDRDLGPPWGDGRCRSATWFR